MRQLILLYKVNLLHFDFLRDLTIADVQYIKIFTSPGRSTGNTEDEPEIVSYLAACDREIISLCFRRQEIFVYDC